MPRFSISGQIFEAPKFENSHQRSSGLALTAERTHGQPAPMNANASTITTMKARRTGATLTRTRGDARQAGAQRGGVVGAQVETPAPTMRKPPTSAFAVERLPSVLVCLRVTVDGTWPVDV